MPKKFHHVIVKKHMPGVSSGPHMSKPSMSYGPTPSGGGVKLGGGSKQAWRESRQNPKATHPRY